MELKNQKDSENCQAVFARLSEYLDAELPPDTCSEIAAHLAICSTCSESLEDLRRTVEICKSYQGREAPDPVRQEVREQLLQAYRTVLERRR